MPISDSLEVAIGLSFIFFLSSLVLASIHEMLETLLKARAKYLWNGIIELLNDPDTANSGRNVAIKLYLHPLIQGLMRGNINDKNLFSKLPSYIPTRSFALALLDQAAQGKLTENTQTNRTLPAALSPLQQLRLAVEGIENSQVRTALAQAIDTASGDFATAQSNVEHWFDSAMDRVSGWYKRRSQWIVFILGLAMAICLNVNTLTIAESLSTSAALRQAVVEEAASMEHNAANKETDCEVQERLPADADPFRCRG